MALSTDQNSFFEIPRMGQDDFARISKFIIAQFGINITESKKNLLEFRLKKRLSDLKLNSFKDYTEYLFSEEGLSQEPIHLVDVVSTNKTEFFREPEHFNTLYYKLLPTISENRLLSKEISIWSAGCSSGEEVYSIAITADRFATNQKAIHYRILGTDVSLSVLQTAEKAIYDSQSTQSVPKHILTEYFMIHKNPTIHESRIIKKIRDQASFQYLNLMDHDYKIGITFSIIFCRNTLIYFDRHNRKEIIGRLLDQLQTGGYLIISHTESLLNDNFGLKLVFPSIYQKL